MKIWWFSRAPGLVSSWTKTRVSKFPRNAVPVPTLKFEVFGGFVPIIPQNIRLSPTQRFPNFPHLSSYFLVPKNWGKLGNPHFSPIIPKSCIFQKKFLFSAFFRPLFEYQWPPLGIFCHFYCLKGSKSVWDNKTPWKMKCCLSNFGEYGDSLIIPKIFTTSNMRNFEEFVPKNPWKFSFPGLPIFPKESKNPFPVLTLFPKFWEGEVDFRVSRPHLDTIVPMYTWTGRL